MSKAERFRQLLNGPDILLMPCCFDALSAKLVAEAGYEASFMSGFGVAATRLGLPDTGLISFAEMRDQLQNMCAAAPDLLIVGDGDTGYGNAINVQRTVREYARAGAAAVMIEDQVSPKRCGHTQGKDVVDRAEARMRIRAAVDTAAAEDVLIMARTDARTVLGLEAAIERCHDFAEEGADILFLEAPETEEEMQQVCAEVKGVKLANLVPGGKTPIVPPDGLAAMGFKIALYPLAALSPAVHAMRQALIALGNGGNAAPPEVSFEDLRETVGFPAYYEQETRYRTET